MVQDGHELDIIAMQLQMCDVTLRKAILGYWTISGYLRRKNQRSGSPRSVNKQRIMADVMNSLQKSAGISGRMPKLMAWKIEINPMMAPVRV